MAESPEELQARIDKHNAPSPPVNKTLMFFLVAGPILLLVGLIGGFLAKGTAEAVAKQNGWPPDPIAVIRKLERQNGNLVEVFYRAVTWAPLSADRELIGYYRTGDDAAAAAWEHRRRNHERCQHS